ncbi:broad specificity phosphatase PhoE [Pullulanibacillus pueri]|uniref:Alpha-ribazole phosphatase n=1 Tax=Pullulanibacillus pueri TaxID=1437324 RepID=A0A8J2ZX97_9BACL|nr:histidine phosphatase family protein [Pullulanibacillus pueri]MBM7682849.1 broad specificity phosphatase PhoE [Pullulanibacillus pueri]GGH84281.1 alpha-ribazole phosphatase [Pullulanibacillus pueri]
MVKVYLLRHGETEWNSDHNRYCGRTDIPLSEVGVRQAEKAREVLCSVRFSGIYVSSLQRAQQTAEIVTEGSTVTIQKDKRLVEVDFGEWEGKQKQAFIKADPEAWKRWLEYPESTKAGRTGETAEEVFVRARSFFDELVERHEGDTVLVTAHNTFNRIFIAGMLGMPLRNYRSIHQFNTAITVFELEKGQPISFIEINNHDHIKSLF